MENDGCGLICPNSTESAEGSAQCLSYPANVPVNPSSNHVYLPQFDSSDSGQHQWDALVAAAHSADGQGFMMPPDTVKKNIPIDLLDSSTLYAANFDSLFKEFTNF